MRKIKIISPDKRKDYFGQCLDCFIQLKALHNDLYIPENNLLKIVIFLSKDIDEEYFVVKKKLSDILTGYYHELLPPLSFIPQSPGDNLVSFEVIFMDEKVKIINIEYKSFSNIRYSKVNYDDREEIYTGGIHLELPESNIYEQSEFCFNAIISLLESEGFSLSDVVRQWNYIENICYFVKNPDTTNVGTGTQNYQVFNDVRTIFYNSVKWFKGYPAATGIGINSQGVIIDFIACKPKANMQISGLRNPFQIDAHKYSAEVLPGECLKLLKDKTSPKFERGKIVISEDSTEIYISGTAAILGQDTIPVQDVEEQTKITIENILKLVSDDNLRTHGFDFKNAKLKFEYFRVYIKKQEDIEKVRIIFEQYFGNTPVIYLIADVCRQELLVEIEGMARV